MTKKDTGAFRFQEHKLLGPAEPGEPIKVIVDGQELYGYEGEPLAMTLLAHGIKQARTTPYSGSARGYFCGVGRGPDCAMMVNGELNIMTCITPLQPGMIVRTQQGLGSWEGND